ncbi:MAG TPA: beta-propeller fold lactonase family protein [Candidatus Tectomicrobia bacterium]|nr:beta-propeller fold lactonase family protein [Candidatus Tectomicrobia bacterium]
MLGTVILGGLAVSASGAESEAERQPANATLLTPSRSSTIALTQDNRRLLVVNRETNSLTVLRVRDLRGRDVAEKLAEIAVGTEPRCVSLHPDDREAYVTNAVSGTVSVVNLLRFHVEVDIPVGVEPRGCAITPNGAHLFIANHTEGSVGVIETASRTYLGALPIGGNPTAIAITNNGDTNDVDETAFVTQFFAELIPGGPGEGFDTGKRGVVTAIPLATLVPTRITLSPFSNVGFTANRTNFCPQTAPVPPHSDIFCPDLGAPAGSPVITQNPQGAFPNQLGSALIRGNRLWLPNIGAAPAPPVVFNVNVQGLVHVVDTVALTEVLGEHVNLNAQVAMEPQPVNPTASLGRLFLNDIVDIDADPTGTVFMIVSRGGNYVVGAVRDTSGKLNILAPNPFRFQTGNIPNGVVMSHDGRRAYVNNEVNVSVTYIDMETLTVLAQDIPSGEPPAPGTFEHAVLMGKLAFFTALGIPDNNILGTPIRDINPLLHRGKQSDNGWSSCASCHPDGLGDNVTWIFAAGPRSTLPLDAFVAKDNGLDQKLVLWSALRGSNTDFNNNSRVVQGGCGFASDAFAPAGACATQGPNTPANPNIYDHGVTQGGSDALDVQSLWVQTVRPLLQPQPTNAAALDRGRTVFEANCASCHGGPKWTKSQIFHRDNPALDRAGVGALPLDPGVTVDGPQFVSFTLDGLTIDYLENVGTFDPANPLEIRQNGITAFGAAGFVPPPLLGIRYHGPYLHNGAAQTLDAVFPLHALGAGTIASTLTAQQQQDVLVLLNSIDGRTAPFRSEGDDFRDALGIP